MNTTKNEFKSGYDKINMISESVRGDFPILQRTIKKLPVAYLDNAATTLKPQQVIDSVVSYYSKYTANIHRGAHILSQEASHEYELTRELVANYIGVPVSTVVFTSGTTDSINIIANGINKGERLKILTSAGEHHSNILPWMNHELKYIPIESDGTVDLTKIEEIVKTWRPDLVSIVHASNVTGVINPIGKISDIVHHYGALFAVDAAQSLPHFRFSPLKYKCDYMVFSAHKMLGPSGVGVLWGTEEALERLGTPKMGGGMVQQVNSADIIPREVPWRFEAGTPNIEGVIGFGAAIKYLLNIDEYFIHNHLQSMTERLMEIISNTRNVELIGTNIVQDKISLASFTLKNEKFGEENYARMLSDTFGIMCRSGSLCAHPLFRSINKDNAIRISLYIYNTFDELERLSAAMAKLSKI